MSLGTARNGDELTIFIKGRFDSTSAPLFSKTLNDELHKARRLVLDLKDVEYVSSAGLREVLLAQKKMSELDGMKLVNVSEDALELLEMLGFTEILKIE